MKAYIKNHELLVLAGALSKFIYEEMTGNVTVRAYPVPRGGIPVLYALMACDSRMLIANTPEEADIIVDDIIDSGETRERYAKYDKPFFALINKQHDACHYKNDWVVFPWEQKEDGQDEGIEDNVLRILQYVEPGYGGRLREGLQETPARFAKALAEKTSGYNVDIAATLKTFEDGSEDYNEMVLVKDIEFHSLCEHHLEAVSGVAHVAYIPDGKVLGLSKLARLVDAHAKRLQVQERMTKDITSDLMEYVKPLGAACVIEATHNCMQCRGVKKQNSTTITSSLRGVFKDQPETRSEFMMLVNAAKRV